MWREMLLLNLPLDTYAAAFKSIRILGVYREKRELVLSGLRTRRDRRSACTCTACIAKA